jgi:rare lipoprotein A
VPVAADSGTVIEAPAANASESGSASAAPTASAVPANAHPIALYVQVGAYGDPLNAGKVVTRLEAAGISHVYQTSVTNAGKTVQRVRVGPVSSVEEFDALVARLAAIGFPGARIASE